LKNNGSNVVPYYSSSKTLNKSKIINDKNFSLTGVSNISTVGSNENGNYVVYESDRYGFNNPDNLWSDRVDAALIGDSFVHGATVNPGEDMASVLRTQNTKTLNLGMGGHGPLQELAILLEYAKPYKVNSIVWFYYEGNDFIDLEIEKKVPLLMSYLDPSFTQELPSKTSKIDSFLIGEIDNEYKNLSEKYIKIKQFILLTKIRGIFSRYIASKKYQETRTKSYQKYYENSFDLFIEIDNAIILDAKNNLCISGGKS